MNNEKQLVHDLIAAISQWADEEIMWHRKLPDGIRLELHLAVAHTIVRQMPIRYADLVSGEQQVFPEGIPVRVANDLPYGHWRLVVVKEELVKGGALLP